MFYPVQPDLSETKRVARAEFVSRRLIRQIFIAIDDGRWARLRAFFTSDVVYERPGYEPIRGIDALLHFYRDTRIIAAGQHQLFRVVAARDAAACWGRFIGRSHAGKLLDERFADVYTIQNGRVATRVTHFFRPAI